MGDRPVVGCVSGNADQGEPEIECQAGTPGRFGRVAMIPIARLPVAHLRSVGPSPLVLVAVWRAMSFGATADRTATAEIDLGRQ